ncbi:hypothetical protein MAPG_00352 [Magnaporthiopsis poae ATCC 64411]|uniref:Uncharacterized protein n=1 Tax=Magnaporthiopsis poae (strain ATCC 64411 / 73-15) TaxID=644358 RepID=A0A0C4DKS2_MAGP6|nr:hypothetical protein MAPG_00352 [Magnaporthiopsis poae ATCC 64411]
MAASGKARRAKSSQHSLAAADELGDQGVVVATPWFGLPAMSCSIFGSWLNALSTLAATPGSQPPWHGSGSGSLGLCN